LIRRFSCAVINQHQLRNEPMKPNEEPVAVFEKIILPAPKLVRQIFFGLPISAILLSPIGFVIGGTVMLCGMLFFGIFYLAIALSTNLPRIVSVKSDEEHLNITWSNGKGRQIPWNEVTEVDLALPILSNSMRTLKIKSGSTVILRLEREFAYDPVFIERMKHHPALRRNQDSA
jgi:hypothetical protein